MALVDRTHLWGFEGTGAPGEIIDRARVGRLGGVTLFRHTNIETVEQTRALVDEIVDACGPMSPIIATDQEGGQFQALIDSTPFAGNLALGAVDDVDLTRQVAQAMGTELRAVGIDLNYAPVSDVISQPDNPSLGIRSFGSDPATVGRHVAAFVAGLADASVLAVAKHFPGKGEAKVDPHHGMPVLELDEARIHSVEMVPFRAAIDAGVDGIMMGHYAMPGLTGRNDLPATVSSRIVDGLLRNELQHEGLIITDALDMKALSQGSGSLIEAAAALRAGVDLLLSSADLDRASNLARGLELAESRGLFDQAHLERSLARIDAAIAKVSSGAQPDLSVIGCEEHVELSRTLARRSVTLVRDHENLLPIEPTTRIASIMVRPLNLTPADTSEHERPALADALRNHFVAAEDIVVDYEPTTAQIDAAVALAERAELAVIGTITASAAQVELVRRVAERVPAVTAALRTPFDLAGYPEVGTHLCTYSVQRPSLDALAAVLAGIAPASGRLPASIGALHEMGEGMSQ